jgi:hypothetical protein
MLELIGGHESESAEPAGAAKATPLNNPNPTIANTENHLRAFFVTIASSFRE